MSPPYPKAAIQAALASLPARLKGANLRHLGDRFFCVDCLRESGSFRLGSDFRLVILFKARLRYGGQ